MHCGGDNSVIATIGASSNSAKPQPCNNILCLTCKLSQLQCTHVTQPTPFFNNKVIHQSSVAVVTVTYCNDGNIQLRLFLDKL